MKQINIEKVLWIIFLSIILTVVFCTITFGQLNITKRNVTVTDNFHVRSDTVLNANEVRQEISDSINVLSIINLVTINISSSNILNGDSLFIIEAPGPEKIIIPEMIIMQYDTGTIKYNSTPQNNSIIRTYNMINQKADIYYLHQLCFSEQYDKIMIDQPESNYINNLEVQTGFKSNQPYWLEIGSAFSDGNGTAILKFYYYIVDFN